MHVVIGTAGHIDHGKSALVRALTGTDPDRLKEEKERGMTTDLGFAFYGPRVTIIDVPGHEKFVRHMLAGATTIDLVLMVVAADDGIMPQTIEHFEITRLLGATRGLVALTKRDLVDQERLIRVRAEIEALVTGSYLEGAPIVPVSAATGQGISELRAELDRLIATTPAKPDKGVFRLPIDRSFIMKGFGTVVAGTVLSGRVQVGDRVELLPEGIEVRVRGIQVHNQAVASAGLGERAALNLQGIEREQALRGSVLGTPGFFRPTSFINASLYLLPSAGTPLRNMTRVRLHVGTAEIMCRVALLDERELVPGHEGIVQLRLEDRAVVDCGDRYVVRSYSPQRTIGGGVVLEAAAGKVRRFDQELIASLRSIAKGSPGDIIEQHLLRGGLRAWTTQQIAQQVAYDQADTARLVDELVTSGKAKRIGKEGAELVLHVTNWEKVRVLVLEALAQYHQANPARVGMKRQELRSKLPPETHPLLFDIVVETLQQEKKLVLEGERVRLASHVIRLDKADQDLAARIEQVYDQAGFSSPSLSELARVIGVQDSHRRERTVTTLLDLGRR
ncbi:MAG: selenocysteine-specific translation elongation factor, partial [candidate division WOR-3 bacterium]